MHPSSTRPHYSSVKNRLKYNTLEKRKDWCFKGALGKMLYINEQNEIPATTTLSMILFVSKKVKSGQTGPRENKLSSARGEAHSSLFLHAGQGI